MKDEKTVISAENDYRAFGATKEVPRQQCQCFRQDRKAGGRRVGVVEVLNLNATELPFNSGLAQNQSVLPLFS